MHHPASRFYRSVLPDRLHGLGLLLCGAALLIQPYLILGWGLTLLPWLLLVLALRLLYWSWQSADPARQFGWRLLLPLAAAGLAAALWCRPAWSDKVLWYAVALYWLYTALVLLCRTADRQEPATRIWGLAGILTLALALGMLWFPRSGFSTALQLSGGFGAGLGLVLLLTERKEE